MKLEEIKSKIKKVLKKYGVVRAGIFGSYARGEQNDKSDVDVLVKLSKPMGFDFVGIKFDLEDTLGKSVDLVSYRALHKLLKKQILKEEVRII